MMTGLVHLQNNLLCCFALLYRQDNGGIEQVLGAVFPVGFDGCPVYELLNGERVSARVLPSLERSSHGLDLGAAARMYRPPMPPRSKSVNLTRNGSFTF